MTWIWPKNQKINTIFGVGNSPASNIRATADHASISDELRLGSVPNFVRLDGNQLCRIALDHPVLHHRQLFCCCRYLLLVPLADFVLQQRLE
jgi:hypothetical protein